MRKNPENKALRIVRKSNIIRDMSLYVQTLSSLAIAESNLIRAGKDSAMPHFVATVKELEKVLEFSFEVMEE